MCGLTAAGGVVVVQPVVPVVFPDERDDDGDLGMAEASTATALAVPAVATVGLLDHTPPPWALSMLLSRVLVLFMSSG